MCQKLLSFGHWPAETVFEFTPAKTGACYDCCNALNTPVFGFHKVLLRYVWNYKIRVWIRDVFRTSVHIQIFDSDQIGFFSEFDSKGVFLMQVLLILREPEI